MFLRGYGWQDHSKINNRNYGIATNTRHQSGNLGEIQGDAARVILSILRFRQMFVANNNTAYPIVYPYPSSSTINLVHCSLSPEESEMKAGGWGTLQSPEHAVKTGTEDLTLIKLDSGMATPTANENRPANVAVKYIIKVK